MWIAFYNNQLAGDVLLLTKETARGALPIVESNDDVTVIKDSTTNEIKSINIFNISSHVPMNDHNGPVTLSQEDQTVINELIQQAGFNQRIEMATDSKFVVGYVEVLEPVEGSDHLNKTQTRVNEDEVLQIVCGASNIAQGQSVIVAKPGAVMPNGMIIWPGELRGVQSNGMICSTRELDLTDIENEEGIWILPKDHAPGTSLESVVNDLRA